MTRTRRLPYGLQRMEDGTPHIVCQECGRSTLYTKSNKQLQWWLVAKREDGGLVVACPQHITEWRLRISNLGRTKQTRQWAAEAKAQDNPPPSPFAEPFPMPTKGQIKAVDKLAVEGQRLEGDYGIRY